MAVTATFSGSYTKVYLQYIDLATYHTLVAVPGGTYTIGVASGWEALGAVPGDGSWATPATATLTAVPGAPEPGAFYPASPGPAPAPAMSRLEVRSEEEAWAERVVTAASDPIYSENRERLARAQEQLAALRQARKPPG